MQADRWKLIEELYHAALIEPLEKRAEFIRQACPDPSLRDEVQSLVQAEGRESLFLERQPPAAFATEPTPGSETAGTTIGRYLLLENIGEGGMGEVWLAEQKEPVRRRVALKLIKSGMNTSEVMRRFESERQALAMMDHPAIARVLDAGSTVQGAPYFVMEYVPGVPITAYCDRHRLDLRARLELFEQVCAGVQHAHQKAIIHRDLKPSNILVREVDGRAVPKIIDFGVAKALTQKLTADTMYTRAGVLVGTPEYMSPEQAGSSGEDIDTRTDVYSLGIIFYELLVGAPPLDLRQITFEEFLRRLREEEPPKPSSRVRARDEALAKELRGDLDSIALKALEKDRSRRYASPPDFAADIRRYVNNEAVLAVPPSLVYRAGKFVRRHRVPLAFGAAFVLVLMMATCISVWQSIRASRQRDRADREQAVARAVNDFLQNDLLAQAGASKQAGSGVKPDPDLKVRTALDRAAARIQGKFDKQPEVEAAIRETIAETYMDLGSYPEARKQWERALDLDRWTLGPNSPKTLKTISRLGRVAFQEGRYGDAERLLGQALRIQRRVLPPGDTDLLYTISKLAQYYLEKDLVRAETMLREVADVGGRVLGPEHPDVLTAKTDLAYIYFQQGKFAQSESLHVQTIEVRRRLLGPEHPDTLGSLHNLATVYCRQSKYTQAEALYLQVLESRRRLLGPEHPDTLASINNLANLYYAVGKLEKAEDLDRQALETRRRLFRKDHGETVMTLHNLALVYRSEGRYALAEEVYKELFDIEQHCCPDVPTSGLGRLSSLALVCQRQGRYALAESYASRALEGYRRTVGAKDWHTMEAASAVALACQSQENSPRCEPFARDAFEYYRSAYPRDWRRFRDETLLGLSLAEQKKFAEADPLLVEGYRGMVARRSPLWLRRLMGRRLSQAYGARGRKSPFSGCAQWIVDGVGTMLPENFQPLPDSRVLVLGSDGGLWLDLPPFGSLAPKRTHIDDNAQAFHAAEDNSGSIFVLGSDRKLWLDYPPFETIPPARTAIDANVTAFQPAKNGAVFVLDVDSILWYEQPPFDKVPPQRSKVGTGVRGFEANDGNSLAILRTDGTLWLATAPYGASTQSTLVDRGVLSFQAVADGTGSIYVRDNGCSLWLEAPPFGKLPPRRVRVDADTTFVTPIDSKNAYVLDNNGDVWLEEAPFLRRTLVDRNAAYLQTDGKSKLYVLDNQGSLRLDYRPFADAPPQRVQVESGLFLELERFSVKDFIWDVY